MSSRRAIKKEFYDPSFDDVVKDKLSTEQVDTLKEFKDVIYDSEKYKKYNPK